MYVACDNCDSVCDELIEQIEDSRFGKLIKQCAVCKTSWAIDRRDGEPYPIEEDKRMAPPQNRQAFINDPRRRRPQ